MNPCRRMVAAASCVFIAAGVPSHAAPSIQSLSNGLRVITSDEPGTGRVAVVLMIQAGDADDAPDYPGTARVLGRVLIEPANHRGSSRFAAIDVEPDVRVDTETDVTTFAAVTTPSQCLAAIRLLAAFTEAPVWNNTTLLRAVRRNGEEDRDEVPSEWERDWAVWQARAGLNVPPPPSPDTPSREALRALYDSRYIPTSMALAVVGDLAGLDVDGEAQRRLGSLPRRADIAARPRRAPDAPQRTPSGVYAFAGYPAPAATDALAPAMEVIAAEMGTGKTSSIFQTLREGEGAGYESGIVYPRSLRATGIALFSRAPGNAPAVRDELRRIWRDASLETRTDWGSARARAVQGYAARHLTARDRAYWFAFWEIAGKGAAYDGFYPRAITGVPDAELHAAAQRWLTGQPIAIP